MLRERPRALWTISPLPHPKPQRATARPCEIGNRSGSSSPVLRRRWPRPVRLSRKPGHAPGHRWNRANQIQACWPGAAWPTSTRYMPAPTQSSDCSAPAARTPRAEAGPWSGAGVICRPRASMARRSIGASTPVFVRCSDCLPGAPARSKLLQDSCRIRTNLVLWLSMTPSERLDGRACSFEIQPIRVGDVWPVRWRESLFWI